jgi:hypothetical protein
VTVVEVPFPFVVWLPGFLVRVQLPDGRPLSTTLPVEVVHDGWVTVPATGADGTAVTASSYVATAATHSPPFGLFVVTVIVTIFPASPGAGVYVEGVTVPAPFSVMVTSVALPPNVFPLTVTASVEQVDPLREERLTSGLFIHPQLTVKALPVVMHPELFRTDTVCVPLLTPRKVRDPDQLPLSSLYSYPLPTGEVIVTDANPLPKRQSTRTVGAGGVPPELLMTALWDGDEVHPASFETV